MLNTRSSLARIVASTLLRTNSSKRYSSATNPHQTRRFSATGSRNSRSLCRSRKRVPSSPQTLSERFVGLFTREPLHRRSCGDRQESLTSVRRGSRDLLRPGWAFGGRFVAVGRSQGAAHLRRKQPVANGVEIGQSEHRLGSGEILLDPAVPCLVEPPELLHDAEGVLAAGTRS